MALYSNNWKKKENSNMVKQVNNLHKNKEKGVI